MNSTIEALKAARKSPNLAPPSGCQYVQRTPTGAVKHCIVGEALSMLGVSDEILEGGYTENQIGSTSENRSAFCNRPDLREIAVEKGLDLRTLGEAQDKFDEAKGLSTIDEWLDHGWAE